MNRQSYEFLVQMIEKFLNEKRIYDRNIKV